MPFRKEGPWAEVAKESPDARAQESRNEKKHKLLGWFQECFCVNCGKPKGMITKEWADYVFVLCDECVIKHGRPMNAVELPEHIVQGPMATRIGGG